MRKVKQRVWCYAGHKNSTWPDLLLLSTEQSHCLLSLWADVLMQGHEKEALHLMSTYLPKETGPGSVYSEGGGLYALGKYWYARHSFIVWFVVIFCCHLEPLVASDGFPSNWIAVCNFSLPHPAWFLLNLLQTDEGPCVANLHKWALQCELHVNAYNSRP